MICHVLHWWLTGCWLSYFNESDLELAVGGLGHLNEEGRLVGVVFDDVVVHVNENPEEKKKKKKIVSGAQRRKLALKRVVLYFSLV